MTRSPSVFFFPGTLFTLSVCVLNAGCGSGGGAAAPASPETALAAPGNSPAPAEGAEAAASQVAAPVASKSHARDELWVDSSGQKWFGKVPLDAFFDKPYEVASDQTPVGNPATVAVAADTAAQAAPGEPEMAATAPAESSAAPVPEKPAPAEPAAPAGDSWEALLPVAALDEEVKNIRSFLQENVSSVGSYNSSMMMIPPKVATLAALAEIARSSTESVSWKDDAAWVRDLAKKMNESPLQRGAKDQKRLQELFESIVDILNRSKPSGLEDPPETDSFAEVADMRSLMKRMEEAEKILKTEVGSEEALGSRKTLVAHESAILGTLARVVIQKGYGYEDDAEFTGYGKSITEAAQSLKLAGDSGDFTGFEAAMSKVATTCQNCHSKYKND
jgi:hypothetical protein